jgi:hypothetical protein
MENKTKYAWDLSNPKNWKKENKKLERKSRRAHRLWNWLITGFIE